MHTLSRNVSSPRKWAAKPTSATSVEHNICNAMPLRHCQLHCPPGAAGASASCCEKHKRRHKNTGAHWCRRAPRRRDRVTLQINGQHRCRVESAVRVRRRSPGSVHDSGRILCPVRSPDPGRPAVRAASAAANTKRSAFRLAHSPTTPRLMPCSSALLPPPPPPKMPHRSFIVTPVPSHCRAQAPLPPSP